MLHDTKLLTVRQSVDLHRILSDLGNEYPSNYPKIAAALMSRIAGSNDPKRLTLQLFVWAVSGYFFLDRKRTKAEDKRMKEARKESSARRSERRARKLKEEANWRARGIDPHDDSARMAYLNAQVGTALADQREATINDFLSQWILDDGTPLGEATRVQLVKASNAEHTTAVDHNKRAKFYRALADRMTAYGSVRKELGLDKVMKIKNEVY